MESMGLSTRGCLEPFIDSYGAYYFLSPSSHRFVQHISKRDNVVAAANVWSREPSFDPLY